MVIANIGAIIGGLFFGTLSQRFGRRRMLVMTSVLCLPAIPLWLYGGAVVPLVIGAFLMQLVVQGCWGIIPAHLNELSPPDARGTFPGTVYSTSAISSRPTPKL